MAAKGTTVWEVSKTEGNVRTHYALRDDGKVVVKRVFLKANGTVDFNDGWKRAGIAAAGAQQILIGKGFKAS